MAADRHPLQSSNLDILRAMAVLAVLVYHWLQAQGLAPAHMGRFGVLIFFVHTSLVLMFSLDRMAGGGGRYFRRFYVQRLFRIYPLSILCIIVTVGARIPVNSIYYSAPSPGKIISNLLLIQNFFATPEEFWTASVSGPLWSLPYEVQMYVLLPLIFWAILRWPDGRTVPSIAICAIGIALTERFVLHTHMWLTQFFPCFAGGVVSYWLRGWVKARIPWQWWPGAIAGLGLSYSYAPSKTLSAWIICMALGIAIPFFRETDNRWLGRSAHLIARYSYGIYLAHVPLLWLWFIKFGYMPAPLKHVAFVISICVVPVLLFHCIESPLIAVGRRTSNNLFGRGTFQALPRVGPTQGGECSKAHG